MSEENPFIFLSYAIHNRSFADQLEKLLMDQGWNVYRDTKVKAGEDWARELRGALDSAKCAIVLWSEHSATSADVLQEAAMAKDQEKLIPATLDGTIPKTFEHLMTAPLIEWKGNADHEGVQMLLKGVRQMMSGQVQEEKEESPPAPGDTEGKKVTLVAELSGHSGTVADVAFSPDGQRLATAGHDQTVRIWGLPSGEAPVVLKGHEDVINAVAFSPDGRLLASGSQDRTIRLWNADTTEQVAVLTGHDTTVGSVHFRPDGSAIVSAGSDGTVRIWDIGSFSPLVTITAHEGKAFGAVFSLDGSRVASCGGDAVVRLWDASSGELLLAYEIAKDPAYSLAFSPDGRLLAAGVGNGDVQLLDAEKLGLVMPLHEHDQAVTAVDFSSDGRLLASAGYDGSAFIQRVDSGVKVGSLDRSPNRLNSVKFSADGQYLAVSGDNGLAQVWRLGDLQSAQSTQVKWVADEPTNIDLLNRRILADALATRLFRFQDDPEFQGMSFLIHVDGPWGSGKSTLLELLRMRLKERENPSDWLCVSFDAWRQSGVGTPWWALLTALRQAIGEKLTKKENFRMWWDELRLRLGGWGLRYTVPLLLTLLVCLLVFLWVMPKELTWDAVKDNLGGLTAAAGLVATIWAGAKLVSKFLFWNSATGARVFELSHEDPMQTVAKHFDWLIQYSGKTILFIIDDLDRCPDDYVVGLLDAVQTLMRNTDGRKAKTAPHPVYFIVAADGRWIRRSYETAYNTFHGVVDEPGRPLGYLFLDKLFQLTVRVPLLSHQLRESFLKSLLQVVREKDVADMESKEAQVRTKIQQSTSEEEAVAAVRQAAPEVQQRVAAEVVEKLISEKFEKTTEHKLQKFAPLMDPNPRSLKRFIMAYSLSRTILSLENSWVETDTLALWTILQLRWPELAERLCRQPGLIQFARQDKPAPADDEHRTLFHSDELRRIVTFPQGGPLTQEKIRACCRGAEMEQA